jgi:hypothetical protein
MPMTLVISFFMLGAAGCEDDLSDDAICAFFFFVIYHLDI